MLLLVDVLVLVDVVEVEVLDVDDDVELEAIMRANTPGISIETTKSNHT